MTPDFATLATESVASPSGERISLEGLGKSLALRTSLWFGYTEAAIKECIAGCALGMFIPA
ncbi:hypothetical protein JYQ62_21425 [Nostoc sp. UHCC 0702]|nr:hypothetical protein JYQ62_21425 [Nostoc sp. UHCC 0702]